MGSSKDNYFFCFIYEWFPVCTHLHCVCSTHGGQERATVSCHCELPLWAAMHGSSKANALKCQAISPAPSWLTLDPQNFSGKSDQHSVNAAYAGDEQLWNWNDFEWPPLPPEWALIPQWSRALLGWKGFLLLPWKVLQTSIQSIERFFSYSFENYF